MNKKEIYHLLKRYRYIVKAIQRGELEAEICISSRREIIPIDSKIVTFVEIIRLVYEKEENDLIKNFINKNILQGQTNIRLFADKPLDRSTYYKCVN